MVRVSAGLVKAVYEAHVAPQALPDTTTLCFTSKPSSLSILFQSWASGKA